MLEAEIWHPQNLVLDILALQLVKDEVEGLFRERLKVWHLVQARENALLQE